MVKSELKHDGILQYMPLQFYFFEETLFMYQNLNSDNFKLAKNSFKAIRKAEWNNLQELLFCKPFFEFRQMQIER